MTQHEKIIEMCLDGNWHCQNEFRALYIFSPHKRRSEIEAKGKYRFETRKCEHGVRGQLDYLMSERFTTLPEPIVYRPEVLKAKLTSDSQPNLI